MKTNLFPSTALISRPFAVIAASIVMSSLPCISHGGSLQFLDIIAHTPSWTTLTSSHPTGSFGGKSRHVIETEGEDQFFNLHNTINFTRSFYSDISGHHLGYSADADASLSVSPIIRTFVEFIPSFPGQSAPGPLKIRFITAISKFASVEAGDLGSGWGEASASPLVASGIGSFNSNPGTPYSVVNPKSFKAEFYEEYEIEFQTYGTRQIAVGDYGIEPFHQSLGLAVAARVFWLANPNPNPNLRTAHPIAFSSRAYKITHIDEGVQVASGWDPADIDADGEIGPSDFQRVVSAFGTSAGDPLWDQFADVDKDGEVGPSDFQEVVIRFGDTDFEFTLSQFSDSDDTSVRFSPDFLP
jgi:hypothetical protein